MLRIAIMGTGLIAHSNYPALQATGEVEIVGLCNRTLSKGEAFRDQYGLRCPVFSDYREMYEATGPQAVLIETPHDVHEEPFCYFARRGVDILMEKPLAESAESARRMAEVVRETGVRATVCQTQRYNPHFITARQFIDTHDLGKLVSVSDVITYHYFWEGRPAWFLDPKRAGGGIVMNYGVHQLDRVHFLTGGRVQSLFGHIECEKEGIQTDSSFHVMAVMDGGAVAQVTCTGYTNPFTSMVDLRFTKGLLRISLTDTALWKQGVWFGGTEQDFTQVEPLYPGVSSYDLQMRDAVDYLAGRQDTPPVPVDYAAYLVELVEAVKTSHRTGASVRIPK